MPVRRNPGEVKEMLPSQPRQKIEGPVEFVLDPIADYGKYPKEGSVPKQKEEAEEVEEGDTGNRPV
jgi:hypothetical protein